MADITNEIQKIGQAVYGEEVRGAIMDALEAMNEQAAAAQEWATGQDDPTAEPGETNNAAYYAAQAAASAATLSGYEDTVVRVDGITEAGEAVALNAYFTGYGITLDANEVPVVARQTALRTYAVAVTPGLSYRFSIGLTAPTTHYAVWSSSGVLDNVSTDYISVFQNTTGQNPGIYQAPEGAHYCLYSVLKTDSANLTVKRVSVKADAMPAAIINRLANSLLNEAPTFDETTAYSAGRYVIYNDALYRFMQDHAAGAWLGVDAATVDIGAELTDIYRQLGYSFSKVTKENITMNAGYAIKIANGEEATISSGPTRFADTDYLEIPGNTAKIITNANSAIGGSYMYGYAVYDQEGAFITGGQFRKLGGLYECDVFANYKYIRITNYNSESDHSGLFLTYLIDEIEVINDNISATLNANFHQGTHNKYGTYGASDITIVSEPQKYDVGSVIHIDVEPGYVAKLTEWASLGTIYTNTTTITTSIDYIVKNNIQIITLKKSGDDSIVPSDSSNIAITTRSTKEIAKSVHEVSVLRPAGNGLDRTADIISALQTNKKIALLPGEFRVSASITVPEGCTIEGSGDSTVIVCTDQSVASVFALTTECTITNLTIQGPLGSKPGSMGNSHGVSVVQSGSNNRIVDCNINGFSGAGIYAYETYNFQSHNSNIISRCRFSNDGCGVYVGKRAEAFVVSDCVVLNSYIGIHCIAGNSRITANLVRSCTYGIDMTSEVTTDNDGHSLFVANTVIHNTHAINIDTIEVGTVFNGNSVFYGDIIISDSTGIMFVGNEFGSISAITINNGCTGIRFSNCIFGDTMAPSVISGVAILNNCTKFNGTEFAL